MRRSFTGNQTAQRSLFPRGRILPFSYAPTTDWEMRESWVSSRIQAAGYGQNLYPAGVAAASLGTACPQQAKSGVVVRQMRTDQRSGIRPRTLSDTGGQPAAGPPANGVTLRQAPILQNPSGSFGILAGSLVRHLFRPAITRPAPRDDSA